MDVCRHAWKNRSEVVRKAFSRDPEQREHGFFVCERCLRIDEVPCLRRLRQGLAPDQEVPVLVLDLSEEVADKLVVTLDPLVGLGGTDLPKLGGT